MITGINLSVLFINKGIANLKVSVSFEQKEKAGANRRKRNNSVVAQTLDYTQAEDKTTSLEFNATGDLPHGVSAIPAKSNLQKTWEACCQEVPTGSRRRTICEGAREGKSSLGNYEENSRSPNALSCEQLGNCADFFEANMNIARKKHGTCTRTYVKPMGLLLKHVKNRPTSQQDNSRESCRISVRWRTWRSRIHCGQRGIFPHDE